MKRVGVFLIGCDDETYMEINVTDEELAFLKKIEKLSEENSSYSCQPILKVEGELI